MTDRAVLIARCAEHGLHGEREECFVCGGPVEHVEMVPLRAVLALLRAVKHSARGEAHARVLERKFGGS